MGNSKVEEIKEFIHRIKWNFSTCLNNRKYGYMSKCLLFMMILCISLGAGIQTQMAGAKHIQEDIAKEIIRFHVIANSDLECDQEVKLKVKDAIVSEYNEEMSAVSSKDDAREFLKQHINETEMIAKRVLEENGFDYDVTVDLEDTYFPIKKYGDITLPEGIYEALCVRLGEAKGHNWWCIVFPTLCFVDCTHGYVPEESKEQLKYLLDEDAYESIITKEKKKTGKVKIRFKLWETIEKEFF